MAPEAEPLLRNRPVHLGLKFLAVIPMITPIQPSFSTATSLMGILQINQMISLKECT